MTREIPPWVLAAMAPPPEFAEDPASARGILGRSNVVPGRGGRCHGQICRVPTPQNLAGTVAARRPVAPRIDVARAANLLFRIQLLLSSASTVAARRGPA
jgi:hypothetical protein